MSQEIEKAVENLKDALARASAVSEQVAAHFRDHPIDAPVLHDRSECPTCTPED